MENIYNAIDAYPNARGMIAKVSSEIGWSVEAAYSFCLRLLEDVNAHKAMAKVEQVLIEDLARFKRVTG